MSEYRICIPYARKGNPDVHSISLPAGYISLEDLLSHIGYQMDMGNELVLELNRQLTVEHISGKREMAEILQTNINKASAAVPVDMEAAHRVLTAENIGYPS